MATLEKKSVATKTVTKPSSHQKQSQENVNSSSLDEKNRTSVKTTIPVVVNSPASLVDFLMEQNLQSTQFTFSPNFLVNRGPMQNLPSHSPSPYTRGHMQSQQISSASNAVTVRQQKRRENGHVLGCSESGEKETPKYNSHQPKTEQYVPAQIQILATINSHLPPTPSRYPPQDVYSVIPEIKEVDEEENEPDVSNDDDIGEDNAVLNLDEEPESKIVHQENEEEKEIRNDSASIVDDTSTKLEITQESAKTKHEEQIAETSASHSKENTREEKEEEENEHKELFFKQYVEQSLRETLLECDENESIAEGLGILIYETIKGILPYVGNELKGSKTFLEIIEANRRRKRGFEKRRERLISSSSSSRNASQPDDKPDKPSDPHKQAPVFSDKRDVTSILNILYGNREACLDMMRKFRSNLLSLVLQIERITKYNVDLPMEIQIRKRNFTPTYIDEHQRPIESILVTIRSTIDNMYNFYVDGIGQNVHHYRDLGSTTGNSSTSDYSSDTSQSGTTASPATLPHMLSPVHNTCGFMTVMLEQLAQTMKIGANIRDKGNGGKTETTKDPKSIFESLRKSRTSFHSSDSICGNAHMVETEFGKWVENEYTIMSQELRKNRESNQDFKFNTKSNSPSVTSLVSKRPIFAKMITSHIAFLSLIQSLENWIVVCPSQSAQSMKKKLSNPEIPCAALNPLLAESICLSLRRILRLHTRINNWSFIDKYGSGTDSTSSSVYEGSMLISFITNDYSFPSDNIDIDPISYSQYISEAVACLEQHLSLDQFFEETFYTTMYLNVVQEQQQKLSTSSSQVEYIEMYPPPPVTSQKQPLSKTAKLVSNHTQPSTSISDERLRGRNTSNQTLGKVNISGETSSSSQALHAQKQQKILQQHQPQQKSQQPQIQTAPVEQKASWTFW